MKRIAIQLTTEDRKRLKACQKKGKCLARETTRAHILGALDRGASDDEIERVLGVSRAMIWRTRAAYCEGGLGRALHDAPRSGAPRRYASKQQAALMALACERPAKGRKRWTVRSLMKAARKLPGLERVSRESVRLWLKDLCFSRQDVDRKP